MTMTGTMTLNTERDTPRCGWICFDADCSLCRKTAARFAPLLTKHHFQFIPLQTAWVQNRLGLKTGSLLDEMKLIEAEGKIFGGADAVIQISGRIWWLWPLFALAKIPGAVSLLRVTYRWVAAKRHCLSGDCVRKKPASHRHAAFFEL